MVEHNHIDLDIAGKPDREAVLRLLAVRSGETLSPGQVADATDLNHNQARSILLEMSMTPAVTDTGNEFAVASEYISEVRATLTDVHQRRALSDMIEAMEAASTVEQSGEYDPVSQEEVEAELAQLRQDVEE